MTVQSDLRTEYLTRDAVLSLLSDQEVSQVSTAETAERLADGEEFVDLENLKRGVQRAPRSGEASMGCVLPRRVVHEATWAGILARLSVGPRTAPVHAPMHAIFEPTQIGDLRLRNRFVMSPMTRSRAAEGDVPSELAAQYYQQRATAGLIITEGTAPSPNGHGYARIPGLWTEAQVEGWMEVTRRVHVRGGRIFAQLMHTGRVSHPLNMPSGAEVLAPSAVRLEVAQMWTDQRGMMDYPTPRAMEEREVDVAIHEHVVAARNAIRAGFDGVELHGANGYLTEQFLNPHTNQRTDHFGGSIANRIRFALETIRKMAEAVGKERIGIRLSPYGNGSGMSPYPEVDATYAELAAELSTIGIAYVHVLDHSAMGAPHVPSAIKASIRSLFRGTYIAAGGFDLASAETAIDEHRADLVAFGRAFLANPDLVSRFARGYALTVPDFETLYTPGAKGYTDYPTHSPKPDALAPGALAPGALAPGSAALQPQLRGLS
jgi:N-ethylmaleimide reductase